MMPIAKLGGNTTTCAVVLDFKPPSSLTHCSFIVHGHCASSIKMALLDFYVATLLFHLSSSSPTLSSLMAPRFTSQPLPSKPNGPTPPNSPRSSHALMQAVKITPQARGSAVRSLFDADSPNTPKYQVKDYDAFIEEDLARNKVFTDIEDFMCTVLHLPENWDSPGVYGKTIDDILIANGSFDTARQLYQGVCDKRGIKESDLYDLQVSMLNTALATIRRQHPHVDGHELRFFKNDPTHVFDGVLNINDLSPDLFAVLSSLISDGKGGHVELKMAWAQVLIALETKHLDVTLDSGRGCAYRILTKDGTLILIALNFC